MTKLEQAVKDWLTLPMQHLDYKLNLNEYLEKKKIKATEEEMESAVEKMSNGKICNEGREKP